MRKSYRFVVGAVLIAASLWVANNAMLQTSRVVPGDSFSQALQRLVVGQPGPGSRPCSVEIHGKYTTTGPDGRIYPTWHPPIDPQTGCYFDHEHGSDPHSYVGFADSGMPAFGYTAAQAGVSESHVGYKVAVANSDLLGRAWMITYHQDTGQPERALSRFHSLDWHISSAAGSQLVNIHVMADYGFAVANCQQDRPIPSTEDGFQPGDSPIQRKVLPTNVCILENPYEAWTALVDVAGVFQSTPAFEVDNPVTVIDPANLLHVLYTCSFLSKGSDCTATSPGWRWTGNKRGILHPGQLAANTGPEQFSTDPYGKSPGAVPQFVSAVGWDSRNCCGPQVIFRIQTFSDGIYIADPIEPPGSAEFAVGPH